jgi:hypothetical protein
MDNGGHGPSFVLHFPRGVAKLRVDAIFGEGRPRSDDPFVPYGFFGCHSSIFVPSGSRIQANRPLGSLSSRFRIST